MRSIIEELTSEIESLKRSLILIEEDVTRYKMQYESVFSQLQTMEESQRVEEERREEDKRAEAEGEEAATTTTTTKTTSKSDGADDVQIGEYLDRIKSANMEKLETLEKLNAMEINVRQTTQENQDLKIELETLKKDQDDFFVLLSSEEEKKNKYREMLRKMNVELEDSSDEEEEEDEEEDDDLDGGEAGEEE